MRKRTLALSCTAAVLVGGFAIAQDQGVQAVVGNVFLQNSTPGTVQAGHAAIGGTLRAGQVNVVSNNATIPFIGNSNSTSVAGVGASFSSLGPGGIGVRGTSAAQSGGGVGVVGVGRSPDGFGVLGQSDTGRGVFGISAGGPAGVHARNSGSFPALLAENSTGPAIESRGSLRVKAGNVTASGFAPKLDLLPDAGGGFVSAQARGGGGGFFFTFSSATGRSSAMDIDGTTHRTYIALNGIQAQMFINGSGQGVVSADVKNFVQPDPEDEERDIVYASLEGPEAAAYVRGTARLEGGTARVAFPRHFRNVSLEEGLTVQLTPRSAASEGLAVVSRSLDGFVVRELRNGRGTYEFDWEAKAVRRGFEDYEVYRPWDEHIAIGDDRAKARAGRRAHAKRSYGIDYALGRP